jgi:hypothetical protein
MNPFVPLITSLAVAILLAVYLADLARRPARR